MDLEKIYHDQDGNECNIFQMVKRCPEWSANRIQAGEDAVEKLAALEEASQPGVEADAKYCSKCGRTMYDTTWCPKCNIIGSFLGHHAPLN